MMHDDDSEEYQFNICQNCQSVFLINPVEEKYLSTFYSDAYLPYRGSSAWGKFADFVERDEVNLNKKRAKLAATYANRMDEIHILDIGCGKPDFLKTFSQLHQSKAVGVDFVSANWHLDKYKELELHECDWKNFDFKIQFDLITAWHYLEHDYDIPTTIEKIHASLKPGGYFIAEVPMYESLLQKLQKQNWQGWHSPRHLSMFSKTSWTLVFPPEKWEIEKHRTYGTLSAFTLWWLGYREGKNTNWKGDMSQYFWGLVFWKVLLSPIFLLEKIIPMGVQTIIVRKK